MKTNVKMFKPLKGMQPVPNSESLKFNAYEAKVARKEDEKRSDADIDMTLQNIKEYLQESGVKMKGVSAEMIDAIYRFENLNVILSDRTKIESLISEQ